MQDRCIVSIKVKIARRPDPVNSMQAQPNGWKAGDGVQEAAPDVEAADDFAGRLPDGVILLMCVRLVRAVNELDSWTGNRMWSTEWWHCPRPWVTPNHYSIASSLGRFSGHALSLACFGSFIAPFSATISVAGLTKPAFHFVFYGSIAGLTDTCAHHSCCKTAVNTLKY